ncbi:MAG: LuxR C-terminal-related transcriptional regulator [Dehalococcoidia bacterium]
MPRTALVGREAELEAIASFLSDPEVPLLTLTGPGGTGKTRLAAAAASRAAPGFADGLRSVSLAEVPTHDLVLPAIARAVGVLDDGHNELVERIIAAVEGLDLLMFLDTFEHVSAAAPAIGVILGTCPGLRCIVTSRVPLHLACEREFRVEPLAVPPDTAPVSVEGLRRYSAFRLFGERAARVAPGFTITMDTAPAIARICRQLDGLPLAIELAAARMKVLTPQEFSARMEHRIPLLTSGSEELPSRQRSLARTIEWSLGLLEPEAQRAYRLCGVFVGGFSLEAAERVLMTVTDEDPGAALDQLQALVEASLVRRHQTESDGRFAFLQAVREHAVRLLDDSADREAAREAHLSYFRDLIRNASSELDGSNQEQWLNTLELELPNVNSALSFALADGQSDLALELATSMGRFWEVRGHLADGRRWLAAALERHTVDDDLMRGRALAAAGTLARSAGDYGQATRELAEALRIELARGDRTSAARTLFELAQVAHYEGNFDRLLEACAESLRLYQEVGDQRGIAAAAGMTGHAAWHAGDLVLARRVLEPALQTWRELGDRISEGWTLWDLGNVAVAAKDLRAARTQFRQALELAYRLGEMQQIAALFEGLARVALGQHDGERAARLVGVAKSVRNIHGITLAAPYVRDVYEPMFVSLRSSLPPLVLERALAAGMALDLETGYREAMTRGDDPPEPATDMSGLTPREREILRLIGSGLSNHEIADALVVSPRTVERHALNIYQKLGLHGPTARAAAAAHAWAHGYVLASGTE